MIDLDQHYLESARRFLQTAIVIDDRAYLGATVMLGPTESVQMPVNSLIDSVAADSAAKRTIAAKVEQSVAAPSGLNAKVLSDTFLKNDVICGLYKPEGGEDMVARTTGAARLADVVVVDWYLEEKSSRSAKDIILGLLRADRAEKGRLRLIAVYTSQPGRAEIAKEILAEINADAALKGSLVLDGAVLSRADTRIVVLNKRGTPPSADLEEVTEEALPERLIQEFAHLGRGVLASFALASVSAVRRGAHHVLALYTNDLDGAFVGHRCAIPNPDDSKSFATDLIASEIKNLIEVEDVAERYLGSQIIDAWIRSQIADGHTYRSDMAEIPTAQVLSFVEGGSKAVGKSAKKHHVHGDPSKRVDEERQVSCGALPRIFYTTSQAARDGTRRLSRLSTFQREAGRTRFPSSWRPGLTLGTLLESMPATDGGGGGELLLCVQPRCDSVRLKGQVPFPFQTVKRDGEHFNVVVCNLAGTEQEAWINLKPRDARIISFDSDPKHKMVLASSHENEGYSFIDADGRTYAWLGDLKDLKAQKWVSELGSRMHSVGMDEFEWLRWGAERRLARSEI